MMDYKSPAPNPYKNLLMKAYTMKLESFTICDTNQKAKDAATRNRKESWIAHLVPSLLMAGSVNLLALSCPAVADAISIPIS